MNIGLIGAPLSGKGTQAERIQNDYNLVHISTGDMFREIMNVKNPLGKQVKQYMDKAMLVPDDLTKECRSTRKKYERLYETNLFLMD